MSKSTSAQKTQQTATNQQVGVSSGIGVGANSNANISIDSSDPEVARASIAGNAAVSNSALQFAGHAAEVAQQTSNLALTELGGTSRFAIAANSDLSKKFLESVSDTAAQNIGLLTSISQQNTETQLQSQRVAEGALQASFAVSRAVAPQDSNFTVSDTIQNVTKYAVIGAVAITAVFLLYFFSKK